MWREQSELPVMSIALPQLWLSSCLHNLQSIHIQLVLHISMVKKAQLFHQYKGTSFYVVPPYIDVPHVMLEH